jgi:acetyl-CoA synthetase
LSQFSRSAASGDGEAGPSSTSGSPAGAVRGEGRERAIDTLLLEERRYAPPEDFAAQANAQPEIYDIPFEEFWEREGRERVTWFEPFESLLEWNLPYSRWYVGGKINVAYNCLDRHVEAGLGDKVAFPYEGEPGGARAPIT